MTRFRFVKTVALFDRFWKGVQIGLYYYSIFKRGSKGAAHVGEMITGMPLKSFDPHFVLEF